MALETITFGPGQNDPIDIGRVDVWVRRNWTDNWAQQFHIDATDVVFSIPPSMPTAALLWRYGDVQQPDAVVFTTENKKALNGWFVKIEMRTNRDAAGIWQSKTWYGVIRVDDDKQAGFSELPGPHATGRQQIACYGLEQLLSEQKLTYAYWEAGAGVNRVERPIVFNRDGLKNRSANKVEADNGFPDNQSYVFSEPQLQNAAAWSTRDICEYLVTFCGPRDDENRVRIPIQFSEPVAGSLPTWDKPEFQAEDQSVFSALSRLCPLERQLTWYLEVEEKPGETDVIWARFRTATPVEIPPSNPEEALPIPPNPTQWNLVYDRDTLSNGCLQKDDIRRVDQVVVRGARRRSLASYSIADATLAQGWTGEEATKYNQAASNTPGYAALSEAQKRALNAQFRNAPELDNVLSLYVIPNGWNRKANNGEGTGTPSPVFPGTITQGPNGPILPDSPYPVFLPDVFAETNTPLLSGVDYAGLGGAQSAEVLAKHEAARQEQKTEVSPLVFFKRPENNQWANAAKLQLDVELLEAGENPDFSIFVTVPSKTRGVKLDVSGQPQHIIDNGGVKEFFQPLPVDDDKGAFQLRDMIITVALTDDRRAEGRWPADALLPVIDHVKRQYIDAGDQYRVDFVTNATVLGVDAEGNLVRAENWAMLNDDSDALEQVARVAYEFYQTPRQTVCLETNRMTNRLSIGDIVVSVGEDIAGNEHRATDINSMITEVRYELPTGLPESPQAPQMRITTGAGELSVLAPLPDAVEPELPLPGEIQRELTPEERFEAFEQDLQRIQRTQGQSTGSVFAAGGFR